IALKYSPGSIFFFLMERTTGTILPAALAAALVGVHPLNVEAVAWLTNINTIMADFFLMATLLLYTYYTKKPGIIRYLYLFIPFTLGLMSKPTLVVGPFLMLVLDFWPLRRYQQQYAPITHTSATKVFHWPSGRVLLIAEKIPFLLYALGPYLLELLIRPGKITDGLRIGQEVHLEGVRYLFWPLLKAVMPVDLTICRNYPPVGSIEEAVVYLTLLILVTLTIVWFSRNHPSIGFGWFWYLAAMAPIILMLVGSGRPIADRHTYTPLAGIFIAIPYFFNSLFDHRPKGQAAVTILGIVVLVILTTLSIRQVKYWQNSQTAFEHAIRINPNNTRAWTNLGDVLLQKQQINQAIDHYIQALGTAPDTARIHAKLAYAFSLMKNNNMARHHYEQALALAPDYAIAHHNFADFLADQGQTAAARRHYNLALRLAPRSYQTHNNLAVLFSRQGEYARARHHFSRALQLKPDYETARDNLNSLPPTGDAAP
ncbi:MAG: tetratricopeptide repeat protein, partial [Desulfosudaceae bacterium]